MTTKADKETMTTTVLTDEQISDVGERMMYGDGWSLSFARAIEQAVLQSPEIQALRDLLKEARRQLPLAAACWNEDENRDVAEANAKRVLDLIARIDTAMEKQP